MVTGETSARGFFRLQTPVPGVYSLEAEALGLWRGQRGRSDRVLGQAQPLRNHHGTRPLELEPLVAVGTPRVFQLEVQGFYDRMARGFGYFLSPDDLERLGPTDFRQLFQRIPGIRISSVMGQGTKLTVVRPSVMGGPECTPRVYLDGAVAGTAAYGPDSTGVGVNPDQLVSLRDLDAVEFYRGAATVPLIFSAMGNAECGTIVLWTKIGARGGGGS